MNKTLYTVNLSMLFHYRVVGTVISLFIVFGSSAQQVITIPQGSEVKEILVVPASYIRDSSFKYVGSVKTGHVKKNDGDADFDPQLEKLAAKVLADGGNVLQVSKIEDVKQSGRYRIAGSAYNTDKLDAVKAKIAAENREKFNEPCAYLTIYRPAYSKGFSDDSIRYEVYVNDKHTLYMQGHTRYVLKVGVEGAVRITVKHKSFIQNMKVDVKFGKEYYVRTYANIPGSGKYITSGDMQVHVSGYTPYLERIEYERQGSIESSMITERVVNMKL